MTRTEFSDVYKAKVKGGWELAYAEELGKIILLKRSGFWNGHNNYDEVCKYPLTISKEDLEQLLDVDMN